MRILKILTAKKLELKFAQMLEEFCVCDDKETSDRGRSSRDKSFGDLSEKKQKMSHEKRN